MSTPKRRAAAKAPTFTQWYAELQALADARGWDLLASPGSTMESWKDYHLDGDSPEQALLDDILASGGVQSDPDLL